MAVAAVLAGHYKLAIDHANDAIASARQVRDTYRESFASFYLGKAYRGCGDTNDAAAAFSRAIELCPADSRKGFLALALLSLGEVQEQLGDRERALRNYRSARDIAPRQGRADLEVAATEQIASLTAVEGKDDGEKG